MTDAIIITQTEAWIKSVVIGCHFCPFAAKAMQGRTIRYVVLRDAHVETVLETLIHEMKYLDVTEDVETTLIILPFDFDDFIKYLNLVSKAETTVRKQHYEGVYQIASFHPEYCFANADQDDPANYTNRSIYPMLHILREESVSLAVDHHADAENIPVRNVAFAREKGLRYMQMLREACM